MKKEEYMSALKSALTGFDEELVQEIVGDYEERFRVGMEKGESEEQIIGELGTVQDLVEELGEMQSSGKEQGAASPKVTVEIVVNEEERQQNGEAGQKEAESEETEQNSSSTYYQKKDFSDTFDSAMKKFGRVLDDVMKEAGRVIDEATEQLKYHTEEARKTHYYTYDGEGNFESSEKEADGEPNVEQSVAGSADCCKVVVNADIADVKIRMTEDTTPKAVCHYYSHKTAMLYPFSARQEGDTFYVGVHQQKKGENKSGFFKFGMSPSIEIELFLPKSVTKLNVESSCGDMDMYDVTTQTVELCSKSGDIVAQQLTAEMLGVETLSGDLNCSNLRVLVGNVTTKSGDCRINDMEGKGFVLRTASGDVDMENIRVTRLEIDSASGDIRTRRVNTEGDFKLHTASGDVNIGDAHGESMEVVSASGDIFMEADYGNYSVTSQSGDIELISWNDADVSVSNTSGDVAISVRNPLETYQVTMHSVSGECSTHGRTRSDSTEPTRTIEAKTISGDVTVCFS